MVNLFSSNSLLSRYEIFEIYKVLGYHIIKKHGSLKKSFNFFFALHWNRTETMEKELLDMMDEEIDEEKIDELNTSSTSTT